MAFRSPMIGVQIVRRNSDLGRGPPETLINVEVNNVPNRTLGPYAGQIDMATALTLVAAEVRLADDGFGKAVS